MNPSCPSHLPVPQSSISRRNFLARTGALSAGALAGAPGALVRAAGAPESVQAKGAKKYSIGLELYSVRAELARDLPGTLREVAKIGYEAVEFYAPYFNWSIPHAKEVRTLMDDLGLRSYSTHNGIQSLTPGDTMAKAIELNQILGNRYLILSSAPRSASGLDGWKTLCEQLTAAVELLKPHGLSTGFHNHQTEWVKLDGAERIMDVIAANTPKEFVLQLDVGTCVEAGADPVAWINANPGRIKSVHLKDWAPGKKEDEKSYRVLFGEGASPWKEIIAAAESVGGVEYYLLEQEGSRFSEFETAQRCLANWKAFRR
jgi:sugar phosphate isomerase/epimerase